MKLYKYVFNYSIVDFFEKVKQKSHTNDIQTPNDEEESADDYEKDKYEDTSSDHAKFIQ